MIGSLLLWMVFGCFPTAMRASPGQPPTGMTGAPPERNTCLACHYGGDRSGSIQTEFGSGATQFVPNSVYSMAVTISDPTAKRFGFSMVARDATNQDVGSFEATGPNTSIQDTHVNHLDAPEFASAPGSHTFTMEWTAPAAGTESVTFYFAGNAANADDTSSGDSIYFGSLTVQEFAPTNPNQAPVLSVPTGPLVAITADRSSIAGLAVSDPDAGSGTMTVTLEVGKGTIEVGENVPSGLVPEDIDGNRTASVRLTGTQAEINATLGAPSGVQYTSLSAFAGQDTLTVTVNDNGNTGTGGALSATNSIAIDVSYLEFSAWQTTSFAPETPPADRLPDADPDKDGSPNALEFFSGSDPLRPDAVSPVVVVATDFLTATFPRSKHIDQSIGQPVSSTDLKSWTSSGLIVSKSGDLSPAVELVNVSAPHELGTGGSLFLSWRVSLPIE